MAAPRYDTGPAARSGHQAASTAGHRQSPSHLPTRTDPHRPSPRPRCTLPPAAPRSGQPSGELLPFGYSPAEVDDLARTAVRGGISSGMSSWLDPDDAYETAWFTIVEQLYTAYTQRPNPGRLVWDARWALARLVDVERRHHGIPSKAHRRRDGGRWGESWWTSSAHGFCTYWHWATRDRHGPDETVPDVAALAQIWPQLLPYQQRALTALAETGTYQAAADMLGLPGKTVRSAISAARRRFLVLWHEHETPSRQWRMDRRTGAGYRANGLRLAAFRKAQLAIRAQTTAASPVMAVSA